MNTRNIIIAILVVSISPLAYACGGGGGGNLSPNANLAIKPDYVIAGRAVLMDASGSYDPDGSISKWEWDFTNDGLFDYAETSVVFTDGAFDRYAWHVYSTTGAVTVRLRVTDYAGAVSESTKNIVVSDDWDNDGLPDAWETNFWGNTNRNGSDDFDDDGYIDFCEYLHGSVPTDIDDTPSSSVIYVPGAIKTIQGAINASVIGDQIIVSPGIYKENINFGGKHCTLTSVDPSNWEIVARTVIISTDSDGDTVSFKSGEDASSVLQGFTITGGKRGVFCENSSPVINKCVIRENGYTTNPNADDITGGICNIGSSPTIQNCFIIDNKRSTDYSSGVHNENCSQVTLNSCVIYNNVNTSGNYGKGGGLCNLDSSVTLKNCTIVNNTARYGGGLYNKGTESTVEIYGSLIWGNISGQSGDPQIYNYTGAPDVVSSNCHIQYISGADDPKFSNISCAVGKDGVFGTRDDGLRLRTDSPCVDAGYDLDAPTTDIIGQARVDIPDVGTSTTDIGAYELNKILYVKQDSSDGWTNAYSDLQLALNSTTPGNEIWVAKGTYKPTADDNPDIFFQLASDVKVYGGFNGNETDLADRNIAFYPTILSGQITPTVKSRNVVRGMTGALLDGFTIRDGASNYYGAGLYASGVYMTVRNCVFTNNHAEYGGGIYSQSGSILVENCVFTNNTACLGAGLFLDSSNRLAGIINCTIAGNTATYNGAAIVNIIGGTQIIQNSIIWANTVNSIPNNIFNVNNANTIICSSDVQGSGGSGANWDSAFGLDCGGNMDTNPVFSDMSNPAGQDNVFNTFDDGLRLYATSPCIGTADSNVAPVLDALALTRIDVFDGNDIYSDMGAYEWKQSEFPYVCSFEFEDTINRNDTLDGIDKWQVSPTTAIWKATTQTIRGYYVDGQGQTQNADYQYISVRGTSASSTTISRKYEDFINDSSIIRISCIPCPDLYINIMSNSGLVASLRFYPDLDYLYAYSAATDSYSYQTTLTNYRDLVLEHYQNMSNGTILYDDLWFDIEIRIDWVNHTYDVYWQNSLIADNVPINPSYFNYTEIKFVVPDLSSVPDFSDFKLNRISASTQDTAGGVFGPDEDIYITSPTAEEPIGSKCKITGSVWYDKFYKYEVKCCPTDLDPTSEENWMLVCRGFNTVSEGILGYWDSRNFKNGAYYLKIDVYDDLGRRLNLQDEGIMKTDLTFNGQTTRINTQYTLNGNLTAERFSYTEKTDIEIKWPGQFPFIFQRMYSHGLRNYNYPLGYGWTHNHNIKISEDTRFGWELDELDGTAPRADFAGLGIGKQIWLQEGPNFRMFKFYSSSSLESKVVYKPYDKRNDYIERVSSVRQISSNPEKWVSDLTYTHYSEDGTKSTFVSNNNELPYGVNAGEGVVDWFIGKGICRREDRFGNALVYTWYIDSNMELSVQDVTYGDLSESGVQIFFKHQSDDPLNYLEEVQLKLPNQDPKTIVSFPWGVADKGMHYGEDNQHRLYSMDDRLEGIDIFIERYCKHFYYNEDDTILRLKYEIGDTFRCRKEEYTYNCQPPDRLLTKIDYTAGYEEFVNYGKQSKYKSKEILRNKQGLVLSEKVSTFGFDLNLQTDEEFNPSDYYNAAGGGGGPVSAHFHNNEFGYAGGGGCISTDYIYGDASFPFKPTVICEHFDDDGDGDTDDINDRSTRKTTIAYDSRGNMIEQRVYADYARFVLTQYEYHPTYNFITRKTTWQGYATGATTATPTGARVEQQWIYGNADGVPYSDGKYLVEEKILLNDNGTPDLLDDVWAITSYTYNPDGQVKSKTDPQGNVTYYEYDEQTHSLCKEYKGADLNPDGTLAEGQNPTKRYYYDASGLLRLEGDSLGLVKMYIYDVHESTNPLCSCHTLRHPLEIRKYFDTDAMLPSTNFVPATYDQDIENPIGDNYVSKEEFSDFDAFENPWYRTLPYGGVIGYSYTAGNISCGPESFMPDDEGFENWRAYNEALNVVGSGCFLDDYESTKAGRQNFYFYDAMDRATNIYKRRHSYEISELLKTPVVHEQFTYDASGNKTSEKIYNVEDYDHSGFTRKLEKNSAYYYDSFDRMTMQIVDVCDSQENPAGQNITAQFGYDAAGNRIYVIDPDSSIIFTDYDSANRKICEYFAVEPVVSSSGTIDFAATKANAIVGKEYECYGDNKIKTIVSYDYDQTVLEQSDYTYDSRGRIETITQKISPSNSAVTTYEYSDEGFERPVDPPDEYKYNIRITDAELQQTWISLNEQVKPQKIVYPSGDYEFTVYDGNGLPRQRSVWDIAGEEKHFEYDYDEFGRLSKLTYPDEPTAGYLTYEYVRMLGGSDSKVKKITDNRNDIDRPGNPLPGAPYEYNYDYDFIGGNISYYKDCDDYEIDYSYNQAYPNSKTSIKVGKSTTIYAVDYEYDCAGRLRNVQGALPPPQNYEIADMDYTLNGNRTNLTYYLDGTEAGDTVSIDYTYNLDNHLESIVTAGGPTYSFDATGTYDIDGLGRLRNAAETISYPGQADRNHTLSCTYDMLSQLTDASITNVDGSTWTADYIYKKDGNIERKAVNGSDAYYEYDTTPDGDIFDSDIMTKAGDDELSWDENGRLIETPAISFEYNWDGKLRSATTASDSIALKYDPMGNRVYKSSSVHGTRKYIVDIVGKLPVILCEIDTTDSSLKKSYIYADGQILSQQDASSGNIYFYIHDRLGSVRLVLDDNGTVKNSYTYNLFGKLFATETAETVYNPFKFTGQWFDDEFDQYYLRARMYDPVLGRFTSRDPVKGKPINPMTLHPYLYCLNDPVNRIDPRGKWAVYVTATGMASFGQSVVGQFGTAWDDEGNVDDIAIGGWGGGTPSVSFGVSVGWAPFADTIYDLEGIGGAAGGSVKGFGVEAFVGDKIGMGIEVTISTAVLMDYIPAEMHGHATFTKVGFVSKAISSYIFEEGIYNAKTWGEGTAMLNLGAILGQ